jgi:5-methylcytosine-specific restriction protein B
MKKAGLVAGEKGKWKLTDAGRAYLAEHRDDPTELPDDLPELDADEAANLDVPFETLPATSYEGFFVPILGILAERGLTPKSEVVAELGRRVKNDLMRGDFGTLPRGHVAWRYRASWALTYLKKAGELRNPALGTWEITESGRARLAKEQETWSIRQFQRSSVKVQPQLADDAAEEAPKTEAPAGWSISAWLDARAKLGDGVFKALSRRLRPDLGPTPPGVAHGFARNVILYGPPGTGKTFLATAAARALTGQPEPDEDSRWHVVQFHPSYAYEDFIQGLRPDLEQKELRYKLAKGPFLQLCEEAADDPDAFYVLVVDEINRGDPARIFGELLYALEYRGEPVDLPTGGQLTVPPNVVVIGTMNSVDRSVALVDYALRRRFGFIRVDPNPELIPVLRGSAAQASIAAEALEDFNDWLRERLGREYALGHSFFLNPALNLDEADALTTVWELDIEPLLEEYFYGQPEALTEARKRWSAAVEDAVSSAEEDSNLDADAGRAP